MEHHPVKFWICGFIFVFCIANTSGAPHWRHFHHTTTPRDSTPSEEKWWEIDEEVKILREYLRIPSVHPDPDYEPCVEFLEQQADSLNLPLSVFRPSAETKPIVLITWEGSEPDLPSILLNSHMDVVPVYPDSWSHPPFAAEVDDEGRIFARGSQDMKSLGTAYLAAIRHLQGEEFQPKRTVHVLYVPDEEIGSTHGMKAFVQMQEFKDLNVGFALDEAFLSPNDTYILFYGEKTMWHMELKAKGRPGHGSLLLNNTAGERFSAIVEKLMEFRKIEAEKERQGVPAGNVTSINLTKVSGGVLSNVIPEELTATFDIRLPPDGKEEEFLHQIEEWIEESGGMIEITFEVKEHSVQSTPLDDSDPYWIAFREILDEMNFTAVPIISPGITDSRLLRAAGIYAIGFTPMNNTPFRIHDHDEFIFARQYLKAIEAYVSVIRKLTELS